MNGAESLVKTLIKSVLTFVLQPWNQRCILLQDHVEGIRCVLGLEGVTGGRWLRENGR